MTRQADCDSSTMRQRLKEDLHRVADRMNRTLTRFDNDSVCLLAQFAEIRTEIKQIEVLASSFYLDCYLSPFTEKFAELTASVQHLSDRRYGALIVIEREIPLEPILHSGVAVDARVTHALLESLLSPVHRCMMGQFWFAATRSSPQAMSSHCPRLQQGNVKWVHAIVPLWG